MTRKDFELIAGAFQAARGYAGHSETTTGGAAHRTLDRLALSMAVRLAQTNPRFDTGRFLLACEVTDIPRPDRA